VLTEVLGVSPAWSAQFLYVLARLSAAITVAPFFGARGVPPQAKVGLALLLSLIVLPLQRAPSSAPPPHLLAFAAILGSEVLVGLALGIGVMLVINALEMGAALVGVQIGYSIGGVIDPLTGAQSGAIEQFYRLVATLVFFVVNGHHLVISSLVLSFQVVEAGSADLTLIAGERAVPFFASLFVIALRVALPVVVALLLADLVMGMLGRAVPQLNVLMVGMPVKIGAGLFVAAVSVPLMVAFLGASLTTSLPQVLGLLRQSAP
jgi:flagellar biosynthetic protein FliR